MRDSSTSWLASGQRLLQAFAMGLLSCGSNPLKSIGMGVRTEWVGTPPQRVVQVEFWKRGECFVIPSGARVLLNGIALSLTMAGGRRPSASRSRSSREPQGLDWPSPNCFPAYFSSEPYQPGAPHADRIDVEMLGKTAFVEVQGLLAERSIRVTSGPVERGKEVTVEWSPSSDGWPERMIGAEVYVDAPGLQRVVIAGDALRAWSGRFHFKMPEVRPGPVTLTVNPGATRPRARVTRCEGISECVAREALGAPPLEVQCESAR